MRVDVPACFVVLFAERAGSVKVVFLHVFPGLPFHIPETPQVTMKVPWIQQVQNIPYNKQMTLMGDLKEQNKTTSTAKASKAKRHQASEHTQQIIGNSQCLPMLGAIMALSLTALEVTETAKDTVDLVSVLVSAHQTAKDAEDLASAQAAENAEDIVSNPAE